MTENTQKTGRIYGVLLAVCLVTTLVFVILSCFYISVIYPWIALVFGTLTLIIGVTRYLKS